MAPIAERNEWVNGSSSSCPFFLAPHVEVGAGVQVIVGELLIRGEEDFLSVGSYAVVVDRAAPAMS